MSYVTLVMTTQSDSSLPGWLLSFALKAIDITGTLSFSLIYTRSLPPPPRRHRLLTHPTRSHLQASHPLPLASNKISIRIETNCDFAEGSVVTITGIVGTITPDIVGMPIFGKEANSYTSWFVPELTSWSQVCVFVCTSVCNQVCVRA